MKRYEIENTTSVNNIKTIHNELVKNMDGIGYTNLLRNNYFKTKLKNDDTDSEVIISRWRDDADNNPETVFNGTEVDGTDFKYLTSTTNENMFGINTNKSIYQEITFSDLERLSNTGVLNLKLFFVKESNDSNDLTITLEMNVDDGTTWDTTTVINPIDTTNSTIIAGVFADTNADYYDDIDSFVFVQQSVSFNLKDDATYKYSTVGQKFRVVINNPTGSEYKYLMNSIAYFGNSDASSFVKNIDDNSSSVSYDETNGEYYISNDGQDKVYLSANKYILTVGDRATYSTIKEAIDSINTTEPDESNWGDERIIYLTSNIILDATESIPSGIIIMGNGNTINCGTHKLSISEVDDVTIKDLTITTAVSSATSQILYINEARNINFHNVDVTYTGTTHNTGTPYVYITATTVSEYINFYNCSVDTNKYIKYPIHVDSCQFGNFDFRELSNIGDYNSSGDTWTGWGIYVSGDSSNYSKYNRIKVGLIQASGANSYTDLIGIELTEYCIYNDVEILNYDES